MGHYIRYQFTYCSSSNDQKKVRVRKDASCPSDSFKIIVLIVSSQTYQTNQLEIYTSSYKMPKIGTSQYSDENYCSMQAQLKTKLFSSELFN